MAKSEKTIEFLRGYQDLCGRFGLMLEFDAAKNKPHVSNLKPFHSDWKEEIEDRSINKIEHAKKENAEHAPDTDDMGEIIEESKPEISEAGLGGTESQG